MKLSPEVLKFFQAVGRKGGSQKSERKTAACRANARRPRPNRKKKA